MVLVLTGLPVGNALQSFQIYYQKKNGRPGMADNILSELVMQPHMEWIGLIIIAAIVFGLLFSYILSGEWR